MKKLIVFLILMVVVTAHATASFAEQYRAEYKDLSLSEKDVALIARAVRAEMPDKSYLTKACVAAMILNRMKDPILHGDAEKTVYAKGAFLYADKEAIDRPVTDEELFEYTTLVKLVVDYGIDPTCGALFCFTEGDENVSRFTVTFEIEGFLFAAPSDIT